MDLMALLLHLDRSSERETGFIFLGKHNVGRRYDDPVTCSVGL